AEVILVLVLAEVLSPDPYGSGGDVAVFLVVACLTAEPSASESKPDPHSEEQRNDRCSHAAFSFSPWSAMTFSLPPEVCGVDVALRLFNDRSARDAAARPLRQSSEA